MIYIEALNLLNVCIKAEILQEEGDSVFVYRSGTATRKPGWHLSDKDMVAKELMDDPEGQKSLIEALKKKGGPEYKEWKGMVFSIVN